MPSEPASLRKITRALYFGLALLIAIAMAVGAWDKAEAFGAFGGYNVCGTMCMANFNQAQMFRPYYPFAPVPNPYMLGQMQMYNPYSVYMGPGFFPQQGYMNYPPGMIHPMGMAAGMAF